MKSSRIIAIMAVLVVAFASAALYTGVVIDVSARTPHWAATTAFLAAARDRSIKAHAADIIVPDGLDSRARIAEGFVHYRAHCAICHGAPGVEPDIIARGMYPNPPDLRLTAGSRSPAELFWIVKNGIKMSGMPAWGDHGDEELWPVVALASQLPRMTVEEYAGLAAEADHMAGGHHDHSHSTPDSAPVEAVAAPSHHHDGHDHDHHDHAHEHKH